jgi:Putative esterase
MMRFSRRYSSIWLLVLLFITMAPSRSEAFRLFKRVPNPEGRFAGQVLDFTNNHGHHRQFWSDALGEKRDLYVYLPPGYDGRKQYPLMIWLHGIVQDESGFLRDGLPQIDRAIACGQLPPCIIAFPDGSLRGRPGYFSPHSVFLNTRAGRYEDFLFDEVYVFVRQHFSVHPDRHAHVLAGLSIGGGAAFRHGMIHRDEFGIVVGIFPPLNVRWMGPHGRYFANFHEGLEGVREHYHLGLAPVGKFYGGLVSVPWRRLIHPLYGSGNQVVAQMSLDNPIEMLDTHPLRPGELQMLVAYGGKDQFNMDAQIESFLHRTKELGLPIHVLYDPKGRHDRATALSFIPDIVQWLAPQLEPFNPDQK